MPKHNLIQPTRHLPRRKEVTITRGQLTGDVAVLDVEGVLASGMKTLTLVRLIKRPSGWLFDSAAMAGMLR